MNHLESIEAGLKDKTSYNEIARKIYLAYPTKALIGDEERQYQILNDISCFFNVPIMSIQVAGSAKQVEASIRRKTLSQEIPI